LAGQACTLVVARIEDDNHGGGHGGGDRSRSYRTHTSGQGRELVVRGNDDDDTGLSIHPGDVAITGRFDTDLGRHRHIGAADGRSAGTHTGQEDPNYHTASLKPRCLKGEL
jgi:hypothetical protein